jgi:hypothetical protein
MKATNEQVCWAKYLQGRYTKTPAFGMMLKVPVALHTAQGFQRAKEYFNHLKFKAKSQRSASLRVYNLMNMFVYVCTS